jgi:ribosomal protein S25
VRVQAGEAILLADRLQDLHSVYRDRLRKARATVNALRLVDDLFVTPLITTRVAQQRLGVSHPTARSAIRALEEAGILVELDPNRRWGKVFSAQEIYSAISGEDA